MLASGFSCKQAMRLVFRKSKQCVWFFAQASNASGLQESKRCAATRKRLMLGSRRLQQMRLVFRKSKQCVWFFAQASNASGLQESKRCAATQKVDVRLTSVKANEVQVLSTSLQKEAPIIPGVWLAAFSTAEPVWAQKYLDGVSFPSVCNRKLHAKWLSTSSAHLCLIAAFAYVVNAWFSIWKKQNLPIHGLVSLLSSV